MRKSSTAKKVQAPVVSVDGLVHIGKDKFSRIDAVNVIVDNLNAMASDVVAIKSFGLKNIDRIIMNGKYDLAIEASFDTTANYKKWKREAKDLPEIYTLASQRLSEMRNIAANARIAKRLVKENPELGNFGSWKILNTCKKDPKFKSISGKRKKPTVKAKIKITAKTVATDLLATLKANNIELKSFLVEITNLTK